jgi:CBS domain-containing protein
MHAQSAVVRSLHDVGLAAWFGGSLMGAVGLNGASQAVEVEDPSGQARVANAGWSRWTPVNAGAIVAYLAGSLPAMSSDNALARGALTLAALSATGYARYVGVRSTTPGEAAAQRQIAALQWVVPALTGALLALNAASRGAQRTSRLEDMLERMPTGRLPALIPALIALGLTRRQFGAKARRRRRAKRGELRARDIMTPSPECAREHDTLEAVARKMAASDVGAMPVCGDDNRLKGMVTDRDIVVSVVSEGRDPRTITAGELASQALVTIAADDSVTDAIRTMKRHRVRRLPVIENHELVGVVSQADLAVSARDEQVGELVEAISEG